MPAGAECEGKIVRLHKKIANLFFLLELLENLHTPQFAGPLSDYRDNFSIKQVFPVIFTVPKFSIRSTQCT